MKLKANYFKIKNHKFYSYEKTLIIAEIGSNHNNKFENIKKMILIAKRAGCDAVKFQLFKAKNLVPVNSRAYHILKKIELPDNWIPKIKRFCNQKKILFACSPFDFNAIRLLKKNKCDILKIASPEIKNLELIAHASKVGIPVIISTGDSNMEIISRAIRVVKFSKLKDNNIALLHCTSEYPAKIKNVNLRMINSLSKKYKNIPIGFSDHSLGIDCAIASVAMGACIVEKHITISRKMSGPDHFFAIEPKELGDMVYKIRNLEKSFGKTEKVRLPSENTIYICAFAKKKINKNSIILKRDITFKRSRIKGIEFYNLKKVLKKKAKKNFRKDEILF
jgi:sialic acid synthase SpsE